MADKAVVTGAFSFTGRYIASELLKQGHDVVTLTRRPNDGNDFQGRIRAVPFSFENPGKLEEDLKGATVFYNTYWVRFNHGAVGFDQAIRNTEILLKAARNAGIRKIVHISVSNPSEDSLLGYYKGKAVLEKRVKESGLSYAIIRPTLIFGANDILLNNIAWFLRHYPLFAIPGKGDYRVQPVSGEDVASLAIKSATESSNAVLDAAGPETFRFDELVGLMANRIGSRARIVHVPYSIALACCSFLGLFLRDVILNGEEIRGLMASMLVSHAPPTGSQRFSEWLDRSSERLGKQYTSELQRNYR